MMVGNTMPMKAYTAARLIFTCTAAVTNHNNNLQVFQLIARYLLGVS